MTFPDSPRVIYRTNPLEEVICQLKFPQILRIDSEPPAKFQDRLREDYPLLQESSGLQFSLQLPPALAKMVANDLPRIAGNKLYQFSSADESWKVGLSREFVALSTTRYLRWEDFRSRLDKVFAALVDEYKPAFLVRVGLRYRDVIKRSQFDMPQAPWTELLASYTLGELADNRIASAIQHTARETIFALDDSGAQVRLIHGLVESGSPVEKCYSIDGDFFADRKVEVSRVFDVLNAFNRQAGNLFRWCITKRLHDALGPSIVD